MYKGMISILDKGCVFPPDFLAKAREKYPTTYGCALISQGDLTGEAGLAGPEDDKILEWIATHKDVPSIHYFGKFEEGYLTDCLQPFRVVQTEDKDPQPLIVGFMEGAFNGYVKPGMTHSAPFLAMSMGLRPKLMKAWNAVGRDPDELMKELADPIFMQDLKNMLGGSGTIVLLGTDGIVCKVSENPDEQEFLWGWASDNCGYAEETEGEVKVEPTVIEKSKSMLARLTGGKGSAPPAPPVPSPTSVPVIKVTSFKEGQKEKEQDTATNPRLPAGHRLVSAGPPNNLNSKRELDDWYKKHVGYRPEAWRNRVEVMVHYDSAGKIVIDGLKDLPPAAQVSSAVVAERTGAASPLPVMSEKTKTEIGGYLLEKDVKAALDNNSQRIADPTKFQEDEAKFPTFAASLGYTRTQDLIPPYEIRLEIARRSPQSAAKAWGDWMVLAVNAGLCKPQQQASKPADTSNVPARSKLPRKVG